MPPTKASAGPCRSAANLSIGVPPLPAQASSVRPYCPADQHGGATDEPALVLGATAEDHDAGRHALGSETASAVLPLKAHQRGVSP